MENVEQKVIEAFDVIADKLGTGVEHFWPIFVKQQILNELSDIFIWLFFSIVLALIFDFEKKRHKNKLDKFNADLKETKEKNEAAKKHNIEKRIPKYGEGYKEIKDLPEWDSDNYLPVIFAGCGLIFAMCAVAFNIFNAMPVFLNPEYAALQAVMEMVK